MSDQHIVRTNASDASDALRTFAREVRRSGEDIYAWKWATIALHNAIQNVCIVVLEGRDQFLIYGPGKDAKMRGAWDAILKSVGNAADLKAWEEARDEGRINPMGYEEFFAKLAKARLAEGQILFDKAIEGTPVATTTTARDGFNELNENRNDLLHLRGGFTLKPVDLKDLAVRMLPALGALAATGAPALYSEWEFGAALDAAKAAVGITG